MKQGEANLTLPPERATTTSVSIQSTADTEIVLESDLSGEQKRIAVRAARDQPDFVEWLSDLFHKEWGKPYYRTKFLREKCQLQSELGPGSWEELGSPFHVYVHVFPALDVLAGQLLEAAAIPGSESTKQVEEILKQCQDPNCVCERGETPAWRASRCGDKEKLLCLQKAGLGSADWDRPDSWLAILSQDCS